MAEYSRLAKGSFTSTGGAKIINLPFTPDFVELINYSSADTPAQYGIPYAIWDSSMGQGYAAVDIFNATPVLSTDVVTANGISTFSGGLSLQYGPTINITDVTKASPASITTASAHGLTSGDVVILQNLYQSATTGMIQICGMPFTVTVTGSTTFTIPWNTNQTNYTVYANGSATVQATMKKVLYPFLYAPGVNVISAISTGTTTTIDTTSAHNFVVGQEVAFHIPSAWGTTELNTLPNTTIPGSPIYGYVVSITDYNTFVVNINSTGYTSFNSNQTFTSTPGLQYPQVCAVGDVNTGGIQISANSALYPPPFIRPIGTTTVNTINGPAIQGAFINNTSMGFIIGVGNISSASLVGANGNVIYWRAYLHDIAVS
jgi:hypothetical protein